MTYDQSTHALSESLTRMGNQRFVVASIDRQVPGKRIETLVVSTTSYCCLGATLIVFPGQIKLGPTPLSMALSPGLKQPPVVLP